MVMSDHIPQWVCNSCGKTNNCVYPRCWKCGMTHKESEAAWIAYRELMHSDPRGVPTAPLNEAELERGMAYFDEAGTVDWSQHLGDGAVPDLAKMPPAKLSDYINGNGLVRRMFHRENVGNVTRTTAAGVRPIPEPVAVHDEYGTVLFHNAGRSLDQLAADVREHDAGHHKFMHNRAVESAILAALAAVFGLVWVFRHG
jgi:hypothetical protein